MVMSETVTFALPTGLVGQVSGISQTSVGLPGAGAAGCTRIPRTRALLKVTRTVASVKSAPSSPLDSDHRPRGSSRLGNQPAAGQLTHCRVGRRVVEGLAEQVGHVRGRRTAQTDRRQVGIEEPAAVPDGVVDVAPVVEVGLDLVGVGLAAHALVEVGHARGVVARLGPARPRPRRVVVDRVLGRHHDRRGLRLGDRVVVDRQRCQPGEQAGEVDGAQLLVGRPPWTACRAGTS